jgi:ribosome recycling factor
MSITEQTKEKMKAALEHLKDELKKIRTGHANTAMLDGVSAEVYGTNMRLRDIASITTPEPRQLLITPYDAKNCAGIGKAIEKANLGFLPIVEANVVRINIPPMDESVRKEMVKICHKKREEAKVSIRNVRQDSNKTVRAQKASGDIGEDIMKKLEKDIQELTDKFCKEADEITAKKEKEVLTI